MDYGYGKDPESSSESPKRRRFQRRNSKTPQMLMQQTATLLPLNLVVGTDNDSKESDNPKNTVPAKSEPAIFKITNVNDEDDDDWEDDGLEVAEELVKQLQQRRRSSSASTLSAAAQVASSP